MLALSNLTDRVDLSPSAVWIDTVRGGYSLSSSKMIA